MIDYPSLENYFEAELLNTELAYDSVKARCDEVSSRCRLMVRENKTLKSLLDKVVKVGQRNGSELNIWTTVSDIHNEIEGMSINFSSGD